MDVLWYVFELAINLAYGALFSEVTIKYFGFKHNVKHKVLLSCILSVVIFITITINNMIMIYDGLSAVIYIIELAVFAILFLNGKVNMKIFISIFVYVLFAVVSSPIIFLINEIYSQSVTDLMTMEFSTQRFICIISVLIIYFGLTRILLSIKHPTNYIRFRQWMLLIMLPLVSFLLIISILEITIHRESEGIPMPFVILSMIAILILNLITYVYISVINQSNQALLENKLMKQADYYAKQNIESIIATHEETLRLKHDMKQHLSVIYSEIEKHDELRLDRIKTYLTTLDEKINSIGVYVDTKNYILNNILNHKITIAHKEGITVHCFITHNITGVEDIDLSILIGNIFDNAIEACRVIDEVSKTITLKIDKVKSYTRIAITNPITSSVLITNPEFKTTKQDTKIHGIGVKSVKKITDRYQGMVNYHETKNEITAEVLLIGHLITKTDI